MEPDLIRNAVLATITTIAPETDIQALRPDRPLREQLDLDSMDWVNLVAGLHERLRVDIPESDYARFTTLDAVVAYLASRPTAPSGELHPLVTGAPTELPYAHYEVNGTPITVRPIRAADAALEADFVRHLSTDSRYARFMVTVGDLPQSKLKYLTEVDQVRHVALVAVIERDGREALVGVVRYVVDPSGTNCEFAAAVDDAWQGSGVAGILMNALIRVARARGLKTMEGIVLATNARMLKFTQQLGFSLKRDPEDRSLFRAVRTL